jgi:spermidine/putrescine transport system permease protein
VTKLRATLTLLPVAGYLLLMYAFIFLPVAVLMVFSFQDGRLPVPPWQGFSLRWYQALFSDDRMTAALGNSIVVAGLSSLLATVLGFLAAYALARQRLAGTGLLRWLLMAPLSVSYLIIAMGLLITFNTFNIPKSLLAIGIGHVVINLPLAFAICYSQLGDHQINIERAARDLGAAQWQVLLLITVPLLWPSLLAAFFLSFTLSWDEFLSALLVSRFDVTLPVEIWSMLRSGLNPQTNAAGTLVFAISMLLVLLLELALWRRSKNR